MKVLILYRPNSEHASKVETFVHDFKSRHESSGLQVVDADSRDGTASTMLYGVMQLPAILALREDGSILRAWEGDSLPLMDEVAYYSYT